MKKSAVIFLAALALLFSACGTSAAEEQTTAETVQTTLAETAAEITEAETETTTTTTTGTTSETTETTTTVIETEKVCTCESEFQHACCEYLNGLDLLAGGIYFGDINGDEIPETVVGRNPYDFTYVLYLNESGLQILPLETLSVWGDVFYITNTKQILYSPMRGHTWGDYGYTEYHLYDWENSDYVETLNLLRESGYYFEYENETKAEFGQAYIDGKEVDNDTFEARLAEIWKLREENGYFTIVEVNDEIFECYMKENFPCFDNWESLPVK